MSSAGSGRERAARDGLVGASVKRKEDPRLLMGRGTYVDDLKLPGILHLAVVRSVHSHARIRSVDRSEAVRLAGVVAVFVAEDLPELVGSVPPFFSSTRMRRYIHPVIARGRVRHVGEVLAAVVAEDPYLAVDAAERVVIDYEPLPAASTVDSALLPAAPLVHEEWPDNVAGRSRGNTGDVQAAFAHAEIVVEARFVLPRLAGMPMETRGVVAAEDAVGLLTVWTSTQVPFAVRSAIAATLSIPEERVRVIAPDVGGGFGIKGHVYPEEILIPAVARRLGRSVKWSETRTEHFQSAAGDRDQVHRARLGLRRDGTIVALESSFTRDHGAYPTLGEAVTENTINHLIGPYRIRNFRAECLNVVTHKTFAAAYRGAGRPEATFVLERLLDRAARQLGMDPAELRLKNLIRVEEMPFQTGLTYRDGMPIAYDPADYAAGLQKVLAALDYPRWRKMQSARRGTSKPLGIGLAVYVEGTGIGPFEGADIRVDPSGTVFVYVGVGAQGQAHETTLAQICADQLGVSMDDVVVVGGDTQAVGYGMGTIGSRVAAVAGPAVARTADEVARKAKLVAADLFECAPEDVVLAEGRISVKGVPGKSLRLGEVAQAAVRNKRLATAGGPGLHACGFFYPATVTWASGAHGVVVEVDLETCAVTLLTYVAAHDCGQPINPMIVEGQVQGGIAQGIGAALGEELIYDEQGQLINASFMEYAIPRADQLPRLAVEHVNHPSTVNQLGIKGVGESGMIAPGAAIANAVEDALADRGVEIDRVPITAARLFERLRAAGARAPRGH